MGRRIFGGRAIFKGFRCACLTAGLLSFGPGECVAVARCGQVRLVVIEGTFAHGVGVFVAAEWFGWLPAGLAGAGFCGRGEGRRGLVVRAVRGFKFRGACVGAHVIGVGFTVAWFGPVLHGGVVSWLAWRGVWFIRGGVVVGRVAAGWYRRVLGPHVVGIFLAGTCLGWCALASCVARIAGLPRASTLGGHVVITAGAAGIFEPAAAGAFCAVRVSGFVDAHGHVLVAGAVAAGWR